ncbi:MAG TPA: hypothetical protein PKV46_09120 [Candidatus Marinimicrobia bacterium]|nr:hypothetical protein [Candidatus Neomarinimicrobiota bacterium]
MGYPQMFALIGSIVLFTSVVLTMNTSINNQRQIVYQSIYMNQAVKLASKVFDKITVETKTDLIDFDDIAITYSGTDSLRIWGNDVWYIYNVSSHYCDSSGVDAAGKTDFQRVDVKIWTNPFVILDTLKFNNIYYNIELV